MKITLACHPALDMYTRLYSKDPGMKFSAEDIPNAPDNIIDLKVLAAHLTPAFEHTSSAEV